MKLLAPKVVRTFFLFMLFFTKRCDLFCLELRYINIFVSYIIVLYGPILFPIGHRKRMEFK